MEKVQINNIKMDGDLGGMKEIELAGHERRWNLRDENKEEEKVSNLKGGERIKGRETKKKWQ
jgi:hypothetical protein